MPGWLDEMTQAVLRLCGSGTPAGAASTDDASERRPKYFGDVTRLGDGWYAFPTYNRQIDPDNLTDLHLRTRKESGPGESYQVISYTVEPERVRLQVGAHAPATGLSLWATGRPADFLDKSLYAALQKLGNPGLANRFMSNDLDPVAPLTSEASRGALRGAQAQTYLACTTPGVRLVWGPPGTGKTTVLKRALDDLVTRGKRVLLVSGTNIAVDNALEGAVRARSGLRAGDLIRVGAPHLKSIAENPKVSLPLLVRARVEEAEKRRAKTEERLVNLRRSSPLIGLERLEHQLSGYDPDAHREARTRMANGRRHDRLAEAHTQARDDRTSAAIKVDLCAKDLAHCRAAEDAVATHRELLAKADQNQRLLDETEQDLIQARTSARKTARSLELAQQEFDGLDREKGFKARRRSKPRRTELAAALPELTRTSTLFAAQAKEAAAEYARQCQLVGPKVRALRDAAHPVDDRMLAELAEDTAEAGVQLAAAQADLAAAKLRVSAAEKDLNLAIGEFPGPLPTDRHTVESAERAGLPRLAEQRDQLRKEAEPVLAQCRQLEQSHEQQLKELTRLRSQAEPEIIRGAKVVATTLARMHIHKTVAEGPYDVVLVDEAGAASLPELVVALAKAGETAVLLGDFCQLGAIEHKKTPREEHLSRWLTRDCFTQVGIRTPDDAVGHPGCAALLTTYRFGPDITELVNRIAYGSDRADGPRLVSEVKPRDREADPEIVLVTTDRLDDGLGVVRTPRTGSGRWWTAGSVIAQALAEQHHEKGESVGIVTPYKAQANITHDWLADQNHLNRTPTVEVGTAHSFQGREFDVVILDLVEDGGHPGWTSHGRMNDPWDHAHTGARLFNVGATRARRRVYIVAAWSAVNGAKAGTVLHHVAALAQPGPERRVLGIRAQQFLGLPEDELPDTATELQREVWQALGKHVHWENILDEHAYFPAALDAIDRAEESVWLWAPWYYTRLWEVLPHLHSAYLRGVRVVVFVVEDSDQGLQKQLHSSSARAAADAAKRLPQLQSSVSQVVRIKNMHQKILVVDERTTFLGSLNTLSHSPNSGTARREVMVHFRGRSFARSLLDHEHAEAFSRPVACPKCGTDRELRKRAIRQKKRPKNHYWAWVCPTRRLDPKTGKNTECGHERAVYPGDASFVPKASRD
ncbi:AAA domain-containing protein [Streptomyces sp. NPDC021093]|uniref:AAA domain-containing protein n=1 Tax=Streptomyces sp. NPDC021093 TaxID=3365112 RepID=UPI0037BDE224